MSDPWVQLSSYLVSQPFLLPALSLRMSNKKRS